MGRPRDDDEHEIGSRASNAKKVENTRWNRRQVIMLRIKRAQALAKSRARRR